MRIQKKISILLLVIISVSCSDLEEEPFSFLSTEQFYKTDSDAEAALTAVYGALANNDMYRRSLWMLADYSADQMFPKPVVGRDLLTVFSYDATYATTSGFWRESYSAVNNANLLIKYVPDINMDESRREHIIAEARFLRALYYFNLVKNFGDIPLLLEPTEDLASTTPEKSTEALVYQAIIEDLTEVESILAPGPPAVKGRITKGAATALLSKVLLYTEDWPAAASKAQELINSGTYSLTENIADLWDVEKEDENYNENIFAVEFSRGPGLESQDFTSFFGPAGGAGIFSGASWGSSFAYESFYESYDDSDDRKSLMTPEFVNSNGELKNESNDPNLRDRVIITKYSDVNAVGSRNEPNFPILRYADVLLIYAEASARANGGPTQSSYEAINEVRNRANLGNLAGLSADAFIEAVLQERSWELAFEADRWYDLTRTDKFLEVSGVTNSWFPSRFVQSKHEKFPIPDAEVLSNPNLEQNAPWQ